MVLEATRRLHSERQVDAVQRLVDASADELEANGYEGLTVRNVARRAGMAPATAYTYFSSKDHLVAEVFWRRLDALPPVHVDRRRSPAARVAAAMHDIGVLVTEEPRLASACTRALVADDPDVRPLRERIGRIFHERMATALGRDATPAILRALDLAVSGALISAGTGYFPYDEMADRLAEVARLVVPSR
ncbi:MAG: TetR/AcrR family transcriptional regulator [Acidimicrobiales bacterium]